MTPAKQVAAFIAKFDPPVARLARTSRAAPASSTRTVPPGR